MENAIYLSVRWINIIYTYNSCLYVFTCNLPGVEELSGCNAEFWLLPDDCAPQVVLLVLSLALVRLLVGE